MAPVKRRVTRSTSVSPRAAKPPAEARRPGMRRGIIVAVCVLGVVGIVVTATLSMRAWAGTSNKKEIKPEVKSVIDRVSELVVVNDSEAPAVATVTDAEVLRKQSPLFYRDAKDGDRLLVWKDKIVLFSTEENRVVAVQPVDIPDSQTPTTPSTPTEPETTEPPAEEPPPVEEVAETPTVLVRNGSGQAGLAASVSKELGDNGFQTLTPGNAAKAYSETQIVIAEGKTFPKSVSTLQEILGGQVVTLPSGEGSSDADILILLGADARK